MPKIDLFPRLARVGNAIASLVRHLPESGYPSERGAAAMLDRHLYDIDTHGFLYTGEEPMPGQVGGVIAKPTLVEQE